MYDFRDAGFFPKYYLDDRFTITINNTSARIRTINVFNPFPATPGVTVTSDSLSMSGLVNRIIGEPFKVKGIKIIAPEEQMNNLMKLVYLDAAGKYQQTVFTPSEYANSFMSQKNRIDIPDMNLTLDVNSTLEVIINPLTKMSIVFMGLQGANDAQTYQNFMMMSEQRGYRNFMKTVC
jgi:hypothetical protein